MFPNTKPAKIPENIFVETQKDYWNFLLKFSWTQIKSLIFFSKLVTLLIWVRSKVQRKPTALILVFTLVKLFPTGNSVVSQHRRGLSTAQLLSLMSPHLHAKQTPLQLCLLITEQKRNCGVCMISRISTHNLISQHKPLLLLFMISMAWKALLNQLHYISLELTSCFHQFLTFEEVQSICHVSLLQPKLEGEKVTFIYN